MPALPSCRYLEQRPTTRKALVMACLNGSEEEDGAQALAACTRRGTGKNACRYLKPWRYAPLREMFERETSGVKRGVFYQTKPTTLLESTKVFGKRVKKLPKGETKLLNERLYNGFSSGLPAGVNQEWQATRNAVMLNKARAQALRPVLQGDGRNACRYLNALPGYCRFTSKPLS